MLRERVCTPVPHDTVHALYALQVDTTQSTGHASSLHDCVSERYGHTLPPWLACVMMVRARLCEPPPQLLLHADQAENADVSQ